MFDVKKAKEILDSFIERTGEPSVSLSVYDKGTVHHIASGYADIENKQLADEHTMYAIGSCTKAFTAALIGILVDEGKLSFDDKVQKHIPEFDMFDRAVARDMTVRDLLSHTSGLPRHDLAMIPHTDYITVEELLKSLPHLKPTQPLRYKWQYSNTMYVVAGHVAERVSGKSWCELVDERLLNPLGMKNTNFNSEKDMPLYDKSAKGYTYSTKTKECTLTPYCAINEMSAAGGINSTTADMIKWVAMQINKGKFGDVQILSEKSHRMCITPILQADRSIPGVVDKTKEYVDFQSYGLGWFTESFRGKSIVHHGGSIDGFLAMTAFVPSEDFGLSILTNCGGGALETATLYTMLDLYFGNEYVDWLDIAINKRADMKKVMAIGIEKAMSSAPKGTKCSFELANAIGKYKHAGYGEMEIVENENGLLCKFGRLKSALKHVSYNFFAFELPAFDMSFPLELRVNISGEVCAIEADLEPSIGEKICFTKVKN